MLLQVRQVHREEFPGRVAATRGFIEPIPISHHASTPPRASAVVASTARLSPARSHPIFVLGRNVRPPAPAAMVPTRSKLARDRGQVVSLVGGWKDRVKETNTRTEKVAGGACQASIVFVRHGLGCVLLGSPVCIGRTATHVGLPSFWSAIKLATLRRTGAERGEAGGPFTYQPFFGSNKFRLCHGVIAVQ